jgi:hypothetical protein
LSKFNLGQQGFLFQGLLICLIERKRWAKDEIKNRTKDIEEGDDDGSENVDQSIVRPEAYVSNRPEDEA